MENPERPNLHKVLVAVLFWPFSVFLTKWSKPEEAVKYLNADR